MVATPSQERLIRKEVALGFIRERSFPEGHIGISQFAPFMDVEGDDVIFQYIQANATGLAPARAEDSEAEMARHAETFGEGRASLIDWALKDHYSPSDISRFNEAVYLAGLKSPAGSPALPLTGGYKATFEKRLATDTALRRKKIDNRLEWLIMQALWTNSITVDDGKIVTTVPYGRPADQSPAGGCSAGVLWEGSTADPIDDILTLQETAYNDSGVTIDKALTSRRVIRSVLNSSKFAARSGLAGSSGPAAAGIDPWYLVDGWGYEAALAVLERATGVKFTVYDSVYRTRGSDNTATTLTNNRFSPDDRILFLPSDASVAELDDNIGFGKTMTSPHPEGNWTPGYYEWEKDTGPDPWGYDVGTGIKAWPVFPHLDLTYVMKVVENG